LCLEEEGKGGESSRVKGGGGDRRKSISPKEREPRGKGRGPYQRGHTAHTALGGGKRRKGREGEKEDPTKPKKKEKKTPPLSLRKRGGRTFIPKRKRGGKKTDLD